MFLTSILSWWYSRGFVDRVNIIKERLSKAFDLFSIDLMITNLFAPFRQISAGRVEGPIGVRTRAFFDRLLSRVIGTIMRSIMIILGSVVIILELIFGCIVAVFWLILPTLPVTGLILTILGWTIL